MSIKNTLKRDLKWFQTYGLIKRIIVSVIMSILTLIILAGLDFQDDEILSFVLLAFILFFIVIYLLLAWVFGDEQPISISEKLWIKGELELRPSPEVQKEKNIKISLPLDSDIKALLPIFAILLILLFGIVVLDRVSKGNKNNNTQVSEPTPTSYGNDNGGGSSSGGNNEFHSLDELNQITPTNEQIIENPHQVTPGN